MTDKIPRIGREPPATYVASVVVIGAVAAFFAGIWLGETSPTKEIPLFSRPHGPITNWFFFCWFTGSALLILIPLTWIQKGRLRLVSVVAIAGVSAVLLLFGIAGLAALVFGGLLLIENRNKRRMSSN